MAPAQQSRTGRQGLQFGRWWNVLCLAKVTPQNRDLLTEYFFGKFVGDPQFLFLFLRYLKKRLGGTQRSARSKHVASQYLEVFSSLAERFGIFEEKNQLDLLCFRMTNPLACREVEQLLARYQRSSKKLIAKVLRILRQLLKEHGYGCAVIGRYKNTFSVYRKLQRKKYLSPVLLNDIFAFRILVKSNVTEECVGILNLLHDLFYPSVQRFKDYITIPKINGYQSIHTTLQHVIPDLDLPIEVQIRTQVMDDFAERGVASHWLYARGKKSKLLTEPERRLMEHFSTLSSEMQAQEEWVYCFSFSGDMYRLPKGATVLDFAYLIHSKVGHYATGAEVNGKQQALQYELEEGDCITIRQARTPQVAKEWLQYVHTSLSRKKIHAAI